MKNAIAHLLIVAMSATYFLLAFQAEPITKTLGIIFGVLLLLALIASFGKKGGSNA